MTNKLELPEGVKAIYGTTIEGEIDPESMDQDVLAIELPNHICIDVGWYPENDPSGCYWVRVFQGDWDHQLLDEDIQCEDIGELKEILETLAEQFLE